MKEYETALGICPTGEIPILEAATLFNIADQYLVLKDYRRAEQAARESMAMSENWRDEAENRRSKLNLGLALGYQGKVKQGADMVPEKYPIISARTMIRLLLKPLMVNWRPCMNQLGCIKKLWL